jgi:spore coat protein A
VTETPKVGSVEIWDIINLTPDGHPIHIHLIDFLVVSSQEFCDDCYEAGNCSLSVQFPDPESCFTQPPQPPDVTQVGWKDTVIVYPAAVTRFWTRWTPRRSDTPFPFDPTAFPGYVWHCHILDHEDNDMMRPMQPIF